ncbi:MAG: hypothetical protein V4653_10520 [Pseudomonadota bacterium]
MAAPRLPTGRPRPPKQHGGGRALIDHAGERIGKLLVVQRVPKPTERSLSSQTGSWWEAECDCGRVRVFSGARLRSGSTRHCGVCRAP